MNSPKWETQFFETLKAQPQIQEIFAMLMWQHYPRESPVVLYVDDEGAGRVWTQPHYSYTDRGGDNSPRWQSLSAE